MLYVTYKVHCIFCENNLLWLNLLYNSSKMQFVIFVNDVIQNNVTHLQIFYMLLQMFPYKSDA